jgi:hypothetical protein
MAFSNSLFFFFLSTACDCGPAQTGYPAKWDGASMWDGDGVGHETDAHGRSLKAHMAHVNGVLMTERKKLARHACLNDHHQTKHVQRPRKYERHATSTYN